MRRKKKRPGKGRRFTFHGAFSTKTKARKRERRVGGFIRSTTIRGRRRYVVMKPRAR